MKPVMTVEKTGKERAAAASAAVRLERSSYGKEEEATLSAEKHAVQKLVWLRERDRGKSKGELLKALQHQRIYIDNSAVHYVASPRSAPRVDARNSVFKLSQRYKQLPDAEQVKRMHQLFPQVKEDEDSGDDDTAAVSLSSDDRSASPARQAGEGDSKQEKAEEHHGEEPTTFSISCAGRSWIEGRSGEKSRKGRRSSGDTGRRRGNSSQQGRACPGTDSQRRTAAATAAEAKHQRALEQQLETHPPTADEIFEVLNDFCKDLSADAASGAVSVEAIGYEGIADNFTRIATRELLGKDFAEGPQQRRGSADSTDRERKEEKEAGSSRTYKGGDADENDHLSATEVTALNEFQKTFVSNSLHTWYEDVRKAYATGTKLIRVNALGYKFIRLLRVTPVTLTVEPIHLARKPQRCIPILSIRGVHLGKQSREFAAIKERVLKHGEPPSADPPATTCAVLDLPRNRTLSFIFLDEFYRNSFVFFMRVLLERALDAEKALKG